MSTLKSVYVDELSTRNTLGKHALENTNFPLHEAARKYNCDQVRSLLNNGEDPEQKDSKGRSVLHILLSDGFRGHLYEANMVECLKLLLSSNAVNVNVKDGNGESPLSLAVSHGFESCATLLIKHGADSSVRTSKYKKMLSLPYAIAKTMPDVMMEILDSGVTLVDYSVNDDKSGEVDMKVKLDWNPVLQYSEEHDKENNEKKMRRHKYKQRETSFLYSLLDTSLNTRDMFLSHPLVSAFLHLKSRAISRKLRWFQMVMSLFPVFYMIFIYFLYFNRCKFEDEDDVEETQSTTETTLTNFSQRQLDRLARVDGKDDDGSQEQLCEISIPISAASYLLMTVVGAFGLLEIYMQLRVDTRYIKNWRTWVIRTSIVIMALTLWPGLQFNTLYNISWQYPIAALGTFFAWVMFLIQLELIPQVKVYLEMLVSITLSVLKITVLFLPLLIGFYMGFNLMFFEIGGVMNFILMTVDVGSDEYEDMLESAKDKRAWFQLISYVFSVAFIIVIAIVFMNFLLGVSINDIQELKRNAKIMALSNRVQSLFIIDLLFPSRYNLIPEQEQKLSYYSYGPYDGRWELPEDIRTKLTLLLKSKYATSRPQNLVQPKLMDQGQEISASTSGNHDYKEIVNRIDKVENKIHSIMDEIRTEL